MNNDLINVPACRAMEQLIKFNFQTAVWFAKWQQGAYNPNYSG